VTTYIVTLPCPRCAGTGGLIQPALHLSGGDVERIKYCPECEGAGEAIIIEKMYENIEDLEKDYPEDLILKIETMQ